MLIELVIYYLLPFMLMMLIMVSFHEAGHYIAARLQGIPVHEFAVGMGPKITSWTDKSGCEWSLRYIPVGGYVALEKDRESAEKYNARPPLQRLIVAAAGPLASILLGFIVLAGLYWQHGKYDVSTVVEKVLSDSRAEEAGFRPGDAIVEVDGTEVTRYSELKNAIANYRGDRLDVVLLRDGDRIDTSISWDSWENKKEDGIIIGFEPDFAGVMPFSLPSAVAVAASDTVVYSVMVANGLYDLVTFEIPVEELGGPVKIAETSGDVLIKFGFASLLIISAVITINLGIMNLLPIPVLDGGHIVICLFEIVFGRGTPPAVLKGLHIGGAAVLLAFIVGITMKDLFQIAERVFG